MHFKQEVRLDGITATLQIEVPDEAFALLLGEQAHRLKAEDNAAEVWEAALPRIAREAMPALLQSIHLTAGSLAESAWPFLEETFNRELTPLKAAAAPA